MEVGMEVPEKTTNVAISLLLLDIPKGIKASTQYPFLIFPLFTIAKF
jgi:hypothetical protein